MGIVNRLLRSLVIPVLVSVFHLLGVKAGAAEENPFPLPPGLESSVEFWKLIFTRYGNSEVIFHDPEDPLMIYEVLPARENGPRRWIHEQRRRILTERGLGDDRVQVRAQRGVRDRFADGLAQSGKYMDQIQQILEEEGVPVDLAYLPLVESAFNIHARSRSGAVGMWQFMRMTGRKYLRVGALLDERKDPLESTRAAARHLKENYEIFGNWPLAITAYNHGREGMQRAVSQVGSNDLMEIIRRYDGRGFGFASKSFYAEFLAAVEVAKRSDEFFPGLDYNPAVWLAEIEIERTVRLADLLRRANMSRSEFFEWNPALSSRASQIPAGYRVKVPAERGDSVRLVYLRMIGKAVVAHKSPLLGERAGEGILHRIARGETLSHIARLYQVSIREIQRLNELTDIHSITAGDYLAIPVK